MDAQKKRYFIVIAGLILVVTGVILYFISRPRQSVRRSRDTIVTTITVEHESRTTPSKTNDIRHFKAEPMPMPPVVNVRYKSQPLHFVYEKKGFQTSIPHYIGSKRPSSELDGLRILCSGPECERQVITSQLAPADDPCPPKAPAPVARTSPACSGTKCERPAIAAQPVRTRTSCAQPRVQPTVVRKDVVFSHNNLNYLRSNVRILGNLYIHDIDFIKIPRNFMVIGDVYILDSEGVTFMGDAMIDGNIFVRGRSSIRALPRDVELTGQIFI